MLPLIIGKFIYNREKYETPFIIGEISYAIYSLISYVSELGYTPIYITKFISGNDTWFSIIFFHREYKDGLEVILQNFQLEIKNKKIPITIISDISFIYEDGKIESLTDKERIKFFPLEFYEYGNFILKRCLKEPDLFYI